MMRQEEGKYLFCSLNVGKSLDGWISVILINDLRVFHGWMDRDGGDSQERGCVHEMIGFCGIL